MNGKPAISWRRRIRRCLVPWRSALVRLPRGTTRAAMVWQGRIRPGRVCNGDPMSASTIMPKRLRHLIVLYQRCRRAGRDDVNGGHRWRNQLVGPSPTPNKGRPIPAAAIIQDRHLASFVADRDRTLERDADRADVISGANAVPEGAAVPMSYGRPRSGPPPATEANTWLDYRVAVHLGVRRCPSGNA